MKNALILETWLHMYEKATIRTPWIIKANVMLCHLNENVPLISILKGKI